MKNDPAQRATLDELYEHVTEAILLAEAEAVQRLGTS